MDSFFSSLSPPCYRGTLKCHVGRMIHVSSFIHSWHVEVRGLQVRLTARLWRLGGRSPCSSLLLVTPAVSLAIALIQMVASSSTGAGAGWRSRSQDKGCTLWYPQFRFLSSPDSAPGSSKLPQSFWGLILSLQTLQVKFSQLPAQLSLSQALSTWYFSHFWWPSSAMVFFLCLQACFFF